MNRLNLSPLLRDSELQILTCKDGPQYGTKEQPGGCSNCKTGPQMGQNSGKMPRLLVPVKKAGGHRQQLLGAAHSSPAAPLHASVLLSVLPS